MNFWLENLLCFIVVFILTYLFYKIFIINPAVKPKKERKVKKAKQSKKKKKEELNDIDKITTDVMLLLIKFKIDLKIVPYETILKTLCITNSFILSSTFVVIMHIENFYLSLGIGIIILLILMYSLYTIIGRHYERKCIQNENNTGDRK